MMTHALLAAAIAVTAIPAAASPDNLSMTLYRSDSGALYSSASEGVVNAGNAVIHERRALNLQSGQQTVNIDGLPLLIDSEALHLGFADDAQVRVLARRLLLPSGSGLLSTHIGEPVTVIGNHGESLARGSLLAAGPNLIIGSGNGATVVHNYAAVQLQHADVRGGARLQVSLDAQNAGPAEATLSYPSAGLGWRAAYTGVLDDGGNDCQLQLSSDASIANRSGRDWHGAQLKLVAGEPNFVHESGPRPQMMMKSMAAADMPAPYAPPQQAALGDYRSYSLQHAVDLPDDSITQVPLYEPKTLACQRTWLFENGSAWSPQQPMLNRDFNHGGNHISSRLGFTAFDSLPAGSLRVLGLFDGEREFLGAARINDTPKGQPVDIELGTAFDLRGSREQTAFKLDKAAHTLEESYRINVSNAGDQARTISVREHPNRWRNWTLVSSSTKPTHKSTDTLDFALKVPAKGEAHLDYSLRYQWTAADE